VRIRRGIVLASHSIVINMRERAELARLLEGRRLSPALETWFSARYPLDRTLPVWVAASMGQHLLSPPRHRTSLNLFAMPSYFALRIATKLGAPGFGMAAGMVS
jgi:hypothetical protein